MRGARSAMVGAALAVGAMSGGAAAQDAVQWRVEDGGNGHWYQVVVIAEPLTWMSADGVAASRSAYLVSVNTADENQFVRNLAIVTPNAVRTVQGVTVGPWIGARRDSVTGELGWSSGEMWTFASWCGGEPTGPSWENAVCLYTSALCWNDRPGDFNGTTSCRSAILEWSADCNADGIVDYGQIRVGELDDANANNIPDCCEAGVSCEPCTADIDESGTVSGVDLAALLGVWGTDGGKYPRADIDGSGTVDAGDLAVLLNSWGPCP